MGVSDPRFATDVDFDSAAKRLTLQTDFTTGARFRIRTRFARIPWMTLCQALTAPELLPA